MSVFHKLGKSESFDKFLQDNENFLVVLCFAANWSDESKHMLEVVGLLSQDEKNKSLLRFLEIEAEDYEDLSVKYGVEVVPTFIFIKNKVVLHRLSGADAPELRKKIAQYTTQTFSVPKKETDASSLNERLKSLISSAPVILFMKGTPQEPRCGFSRQTVEILRSQNVSFSFFDILSDNDVREGLKKYSNWPTYPQLYAKGELIGGLDIIKDLVESGEFKNVMPESEASLDERLNKLINKHKIMLFMKGSPSEPKCGFSRQTIEILKETGCKYDSFDILSDEEVRQGLKEYSKWPTYPQIYVDGELVGGLDIIKELKQNGELEQTLKGKTA